MAVNRYKFDGFQYRRSQDTGTHEVEIGYVKDGGKVFEITVIRNKAHADGNFLIADANRGGESVWSFKTSGFAGRAVLAKAGAALVIALIGQEGKVEEVVPFSRFYAEQQMDLRSKYQLKRGAAEFLGCDYKSTKVERDYSRILGERARATQETQRAEAAKVRDEKRTERMMAIMARGKMNVYTLDGQARYGWPVTEAEWPSLSKGAHAVLVDRIGEDGSIGNVLESFVVIKNRGKNPEKGSLVPVTIKRPANVVTAKKSPMQPTRSTIIEVDGVPYEVSLYPDKDAIRKAREAGLNSGTYTAVIGEVGSMLEVYEVHKDHVKTLGHFSALV